MKALSPGSLRIRITEKLRNGLGAQESGNGFAWTSMRRIRYPSGAMKKALVLLSGGIDSSTLLFYVKQRINVPSVYALSFLYGQKHARELDAARWQAERAGVRDHRIVDISFLHELLAGAGCALLDPEVDVPDLAGLDRDARSHPPTYVPNRNMILLAIAAAFAETLDVSDVFYGAQAHDEYGYWDCSDRFVKRLNNALALNRKKPVMVHAPFAGMTKAKALGIGFDLGVDYAHTWSCYRGEDKPCGSCPTCVERARAFRENDKPDPLS